MSQELTTLQKALVTIQKLKKKLAEKPQFKPEPIAITGLSCRFPTAQNKYEFWHLLQEGRNTVSVLPEKRWELLKGSHEYAARDFNRPYWGSYLEDIAGFDAYFFGIAPREAERMDPQQRLLLEVAYEAFEDAGLLMEDLQGSHMGVFASLYASQFGFLQQIENDLDALYIPTGNAISIAANRISYIFDLRGPSMVLDTACSSTLIALHLACLNLHNNLCDTALVCGANINFSPSINAILADAKMLSADGQCKTFDASANGYVQGEGIGAIILKPLSKALQDKDRIYAVIHATSMNQDGKTNGLTAPNGLQQQEVIKNAYAAAGLDPKDIGYVECHGTGTFLGDPIELQALGEVIGKNRDPMHPCWLGSLKSNIGHLEPAAGIASVIKVALSLHHGQIPKQIQFNKPNPHIAFDRYHFKIPVTGQDWPRNGVARSAGISGFGFGGTNAHVVLRECTEPPFDENIIAKHTEIFTLSAKNPDALNALIKKWVSFIKDNSNLSLSKICYNLHVRRTHYAYRIAILVDTLDDLLVKLSTLVAPTSIHATNHIPNDVCALPLEKLAEIYCASAMIDWKAFEKNRSFSHMDLPSYSWQHKDYWPPLGRTDENWHLFSGKKIESPLDILQFDFQFDCKKIPAIKDTFNILHAGYYLEMLAFVMQTLYQCSDFSVEEMQFLAPIVVNDKESVHVQLVLTKIDEGFNFTFYSKNSSQNRWLEHAVGKLKPKIDKVTAVIPLLLQDVSLPRYPAAKFYQRIEAMGMPSQGSIQWTHQYWFCSNEIVCQFQKPKLIENESRLSLKIHFGIIDACIQGMFLVLPEDCMNPYVATRIEKINIRKRALDKLYLYSQLTKLEENKKKYTGNWFLIDDKGDFIMECQGLAMTQLGNKIQINQLAESNDHQINILSFPENERISQLTHYLVKRVATLFSMPVVDVKPDVSLLQMGIDSLMALALLQIIEKLGVTLTLDKILQGPTLAELAENIIGHCQANQVLVTQHPKCWIASKPRKVNPMYRLFCFPYGGGGASIYRDWQQKFPEGIEICAVQLPGREERMDEVPVRSLEELITLLIKNLQNEFDRPFAFFGHSFGALIGFELARALRKQSLELPQFLFASAFPDPRLPSKSLENLLKQLENIGVNLFDLRQESIARLNESLLDKIFAIFHENGLTDYNNQAMNKEIIKVLLPIFISDMSIVKSYRYYEDTPLDLPITVFSGNQDAWVTTEDQLGWQRETSKQFNIVEFSGGHLFLRDPAIKNKLLAALIHSLGVVSQDVVED